MTTLALTPSNATAAAFRAWGSAISAAIAGLGMVQTADTGQINWTTVAAPVATSTAAGYEIWRFADSLQSSAPVYFKLEYGSNASAATAPGMWVTVGTGSDGAGTITGTAFAASGIASTALIATRTQLHTTNANTFSGGTQVFVNGSSSALALLLWPTSTSGSSTGAFLVIERTHNFDGTDNADGYSAIIGKSSNGASGCTTQQYCASFIPNGFTYAGTFNEVAVVGRSNVNEISAASYVVGGVLYPTPIFTGYNGRLSGSSKYLMALPLGDYGAGQTVSITHYGVAANWLDLGLGSTTSGAIFWGLNANSSKTPLVRIS